MKLYPKQIFSVFLTACLVWVFVGCVFLCVENEICAEDFNNPSETSVTINESSHGDFCPIQTSVKTTAPERIIFDSPAHGVKVSAIFSVIAVLPDSLKYQLKFYRPPNTTSRNKRPFVLRI